MSVARRRPEPPMTVEQFLDMPADPYGRHWQLIDGVPVLMSPPSNTHGALQARLAELIGVHLDRHRPSCEVLITPGVQPRVRAAHNLREPDLAVTCPFVPGRLLEAPVMICEILSPSNASETREAVRACLTVPSLIEVLVVASETIGAELLVRGPDGTWPAEPQRFGSGETLRLPVLGFESAMDELYSGLGLP
jgi:Uma2 family endonuclease